MNFLLVNDDGYDAPGLKALRAVFEKIGRVVTFAPKTEQSATSHRITIRDLIFMEKIDDDIYAVESSPADCVRLGLFHPSKDIPKFDYVISGINKGGNIGSDIYYSGTLAGAREAALLGVPGFSFSMWVDHSKPTPTFEFAAKESLRIFKMIIENNLLEKNLYYNINFPQNNDYKGASVTKAGRFIYKVDVVEGVTPRNDTKSYYINAFLCDHEFEGGDDFYTLQEGKVSINPLWIGDSVKDLIGRLKSLF